MSQGNTADPKSVKRSKRRYQLYQEQWEEDLKKVLGTTEGAAVVWKILSEAGIYALAGLGAEEFHEGKRSVGLWLLHEIINIDENYYTKIRTIGAKREGRNA